MALKVYGGELILSGTQVIAVTGALEAYHEIGGSGKGIQISDGGAITAGSDIYFHVSGSSIANKEGVAVFGGDLVVSGTLYDGDGDAISLTLANDANNRVTTGVGDGTINAEANLTFDGSTLTVTGDATITDDLTLNSDSAVFNMGDGSDFKITHDGTTGATLTGNPITITSAGAATWSTSAGALTIDAAGALTLDTDGTDAVNLGIEAAAKTITIGNAASTKVDVNALAIELDSAGDITLDAGGADIVFKDDGTEVGSLSMTGTTNMALRAKGLLSLTSDQDKIVFRGADDIGALDAEAGKYLTIEWGDGSASSDDAILSASISDATICLFASISGSSKEYIRAGKEQVLIMSGWNSSENSLDPKEFTDTNFFVSGVIGGRQTDNRDEYGGGTAVFGGDMVVSGGLTIGYKPTESDDGLTENVVVHSKNYEGIFVIDTDNGQVQIGGTSGESGQSITAGEDANFFVSGNMGSVNGAGKGSAGQGHSVFTGDVLLSGALHALQGVSGSLQRLASGVSYLVAGSGMTITSGSSTGQVTLASTAASVAADDITEGDAATNIVTSAGAILIDSQASTTTVDGHTGVTIQAPNSGAEIELNAAADIKIDAGGGVIKFLDDGTAFATIENSSTDMIISASVANKDIIFQGQSTGAATEIARFDTSATALLMASTNKLQFTDSGMFIHGASDGDLLISSDGTADDSLKLQASSGAGGGGGIFLTGSVMQVTGTRIQLVSTHKALILSGSGENEGYGDAIQVSGTLNYGGHAGGAQLGGQQHPSQKVTLYGGKTTNVVDLSSLTWKNQQVAHVQVSYFISRAFSGGTTRVEGGRLYITMDMTGSNVSAVANNQGGDVGITWSTQDSATTSSLQYTSTGDTAAGTMRFQVERIFKY